MAEKQKTLSKAVSLSGKGLHTGIDVTITLNPAPENHGFVFQRIDLPGKPIINALAENVTDTSRGTTLEQNNAKVCTIEHCLAACTGMELDNVLIEINGPEAPILDGSSIQYVNAIEKAGIEEQNAEKIYFTPTEKVEYYDEEKKIHIIAYPDEQLSMNVLIDYNSKVLGNQYATLADLKDFKTDIGPSRTFVFLHELELLAANNLIKGGDLDNAIVIMDRQVNQEELDRLAELFNKPKIKVKPEGVLNNIDLHFPNEPARHKLLDMIGDLALIGMPFKGKIIAQRPGHQSNTEFARILRQMVKKSIAKKDVPIYNPNDAPLVDIVGIQKTLPHRSPFLLVDKIIYRDDKKIVGIKNITMNEPFFVGHFPDEPIMPGVLQIEALAQVGGLLVLNTVTDPENYLTFFLKIDKVKFKRKVVPGDTLIMKMSLLEPIRRGIAIMFGQGYVGDKLVIEGELMAQITKVKE
ncbi:MAG: bifunctional UDP-3-O-[3-hydroxymyristoyl] N-acetylglucosamine deacetylase/3-hydroxyacyl-ACP dehydratase [Bacteroidales bacterium]|nr:bifunctional UDP-3-O-[3-hydroxymyristoyl] N-acetylglucosamine deacetylase/3-hydroxyacyl-ACP dehydratase [Bacteroidales bacterium]